jgi:hypothetical protein
MSAFLTEPQIRQQARKIRSAFNALMLSKRVVSRPTSRQWQFFRHCFDVLMGEALGDFPCTAQAAAQYKFEVSKRLRNYYRLPGDAVSFVFSLTYKDGDRRLPSEDYPTANGYALLVTRNVADALDRNEIEARLERVIADAVDAEWTVYMKLPQLDILTLDSVFETTGSAYKRIRMIAESHHKKRWTINNPGNPSTRRLVTVKVEELSPNSAKIRTEEYWYLRWWSIDKKIYAYIYNEMNRQMYFVVKRGDRWLVRDNFYPKTKTSTPLRWSK